MVGAMKMVEAAKSECGGIEAIDVVEAVGFLLSSTFPPTT